MDQRQERLEKYQTALNLIEIRIKSGRLPGITFKAGTATVDKASKKAMDQFGALAERYPDLTLVILGFAGGKALAADRAATVAKYLTMTYRVSPDRVTSRAGDPAQQPRNTEVTFQAELPAKP